MRARRAWRGRILSTAMKSPASILIVDDESQNRRLLEALLTPEGYALRTAGGGKQALASIAQDRPDLILLDFLMPGVDGRQVASAVKADPATRNIPIARLSRRSLASWRCSPTAGTG